jgi:hypothetical protein
MCEVIPFPAKQRVGKIRRVAQVLSGRSGKSADRYWIDTVASMENQMLAAGIDEETIRHEVAAFRDAVSWQLQRRDMRA